jgi:hypothetical protein
MKIRSITCFFDPRSKPAYQAMQKLASLAETAKELFAQARYEVQSVRLATAPFSDYMVTDNLRDSISLVKTLETEANEHHFGYISLGPALPRNLADYRLIPALLAETQNVFFSAVMASPSEGLSLPAVRACAEIIHQAATLTPDGFTNLRFAALSNVPPHAPFFPAAYHVGTRPAFALAIECADEAVAAFRVATSLEDARQRLLDTLEEHGRTLTSLTVDLVQRFEVDFRGLDFSLAPFPAEWCSLGAALERLGLPALGAYGSVAAAAFVADTLNRGRWLKTGFNGLMLPVLEDATLAKRAAEGTFTVKDLLLYSAVCGTGLDTVPLPGDTSVEQLYALLLDLAALGMRLNKPLTARLMPIPGKRAGDATAFDFSFFANSRVMALQGEPLKGLLASDETFSLSPR